MLSHSRVVFACAIAAASLPGRIAICQVTPKVEWDYIYYDNTKTPGFETFKEVRSPKELLERELKAFRAHVNGEATASLNANFSAETLDGAKYSLGFVFETSAHGTIIVDPDAPETWRSASAQIEGQISYSDRVTFIGSGELPFDSVIVNWKASGRMEGVLSGGSNRQVWARLNLRSRSGDFSAVAEYRHIQGIGANGELQESLSESNSVSGLLGMSVPIGGLKDFDPSWFADLLMVSTHGKIGVHYGQTLTMDSIVFPDGTTPEDRGFQLAFDSGIKSPNLAVAENADFDADGRVDGADFLIWQRGFGATSATLAQGDATADGVVGDADLDVWRQAFQQTSSPAAHYVPEPEAGLWLAGLGLAMARRGRG